MTSQRIKILTIFYLLLCFVGFTLFTTKVSTLAPMAMALGLTMVFIFLFGIFGIEKKDQRLFSILISWGLSIQVSIFIIYIYTEILGTELLVFSGALMIGLYFLIKKYQGSDWLKAFNIIVFLITSGYYYATI
jgi:hypothetical protein